MVVSAGGGGGSISSSSGSSGPDRGGDELRIWNVTRGECVGRASIGGGSSSTLGAGDGRGTSSSSQRSETCTSLAFASGGSLLSGSVLTGSDTGQLKIWDVANSGGSGSGGGGSTGEPRLVGRFSAHGGRVTCLVCEGGEGATMNNSNNINGGGGGERAKRSE